MHRAGRSGDCDLQSDTCLMPNVRALLRLMSADGGDKIPVSDGCCSVITLDKKREFSPPSMGGGAADGDGGIGCIISDDTTCVRIPSAGTQL